MSQTDSHEENEHLDYEGLAWLYNAHWEDFGGRAMPAIEGLLLPKLPAGAAILDVCCGPGHLARELSGRGYSVAGFDLSEAMLRFARANAPEAEFFRADARSFTLPPIHQAAISTFDSLNHLMHLEELAGVFRNVYAALAPGGLFLFDLNTEEGYRSFWEGSFNIVAGDHACIVRCDYDEQQRTAEFNITIFRLREHWERSDLRLTQRCHSEREVRSALRSAGFRDVRAYAYEPDEGLFPPDEEAVRLFFLCRKPRLRNAPSK